MGLADGVVEAEVEAELDEVGGVGGAEFGGVAGEFF